MGVVLVAVLALGLWFQMPRCRMVFLGSAPALPLTHGLAPLTDGRTHCPVEKGMGAVNVTRWYSRALSCVAYLMQPSQSHRSRAHARASLASWIFQSSDFSFASASILLGYLPLIDGRLGRARFERSIPYLIRRACQAPFPIGIIGLRFAFQVAAR